MYLYKKIGAVAVLLCGFVLFVSLDSLAQEGPRRSRGKQRMQTPEQRTEHQLLRLTEQLTLTEKQQARVKTVLQKQATKLTALRDNASVKREQKRTKFRQITSDIRNQIRTLLTAEQ